MKGKSLWILSVTLLLIVVISVITVNGIQIGKYRFNVPQSIKLGLDLRGGVYAVYVANDDSAEDFESLMQGTVRVIRNRLSGKGMNEATVTRQGSNRIRVEIPDVTDPNEILNLIGTPAHLEFKDPNGDVVLTGADIADAFLSMSETGEYVVSFALNDSGRQAFAEATTKYINQAISIVLDDVVISSPTVQSAITDGKGIITGMGSAEAANTLAQLILSGALPLDITQDEVSAISATLGVEALNTSIFAGVIGMALVILFMLAVYRLPGLIAGMALCLYVLIVVYLLALIPGVQLTLPGIAGILLGIGMAVDGNVVIFERFREELRAGRSLTDAVNRGFKNALSAVVDSNVTTIIAALVLMYFGTGTIKGFAITLLIGVITSMFSSIFVTRFLLKQVVRVGVKNIALYSR